MEKRTQDRIRRLRLPAGWLIITHSGAKLTDLAMKPETGSLTGARGGAWSGFPGRLTVRGQPAWPA